MKSPPAIELPEKTKALSSEQADSSEPVHNVHKAARQASLRAFNVKDTQKRDIEEAQAKEEYELRCYFRNVRFFPDRNHFVPTYLKGFKFAEQLSRVHLPTRWSKEDSSEGLEISNDGLEVKSPAPESISLYSVHSVRTDHPMPLELGFYYFEITIIISDIEKYALHLLTRQGFNVT